MRFLFYSHDGFGLGHTCRNLAIARALNKLAPRASVLLATGSDDVTRLGVPDGVEILKLPGLRKLTNEAYASRYLGVPSNDVRLLRSRLLLSAVEAYQPSVLLVDKHPFGAGGELRDALAAIRKFGGKAVLGLRDILDDPATVRAEWTPHHLPGVIPAHYDSVLVYGQEEVFNTAAAYDFPASLKARTHYSGYVNNPSDLESASKFSFHSARKRPLVLATVGGGEDGFQLLKNFLAACIDVPWQAVAVTGPMMNAVEFSELEQLARAQAVKLHAFVPNLHHWFAAAAAVVCMGGYNTLTQTLAAGAPVVCVPRVQPRLEQFVRAQAFAKLGLLHMITPDQLSPERLREEINAAIMEPRAALQQRLRSCIEFDGAEFAAHHLLAVARTARIRVRRRAAEAGVAP